MRDEKEYVSQEIINGEVYVVHHYDNGHTSIMGDPQGDFAKRLAKEITNAQNNQNSEITPPPAYDEYVEEEEFKYDLLTERRNKIENYKSWYDNLSDEEKKVEDNRVLKAKEEHDKKISRRNLTDNIFFIVGILILVLPMIIFLFFCMFPYKPS